MYSNYLRSLALFSLMLFGWNRPVFTQPPQEPAQPLERIAFGSCAKQDKELKIFDAIVNYKPQLYLSLGDNIYADTEDMSVMKAKYDQMKALPAYAKLRAMCPTLATWDDHDYGKNDAGVEYPKKDEAQKLFWDFLDLPANDPQREQKGVYNAKIFGPEGKRVQVIMLDGRYFRTALRRGKRQPGMTYTPYIPSTEPGATLLGEAQWKWLEEQLKKPAEIRLLVTGTQLVSDDHGFEKWGNFPNEKTKLFELIQSTQAKGLIVLSGDRHLADLSMQEGVIPYPLYDLTSSGLNQGAPNWRPFEKNKHRIGGMPYGNNFGTIGIQWGENTVISLQIRDEAGELVVNHKVPLSILQPGSTKGPMAKEEPDTFKPSEGAITAAEAAKKNGEKVTMEMKVAAVGGSAKSRIFLNSKTNFRDEDNFTVVVTSKALTGKLDKAGPDTFKGKIIRVTATVSEYQGRTQIVIENEADITLRDK